MNVTTSIASGPGAASPHAASQANEPRMRSTRLVRVRVFPDPAPAETIT